MADLAAREAVREALIRRYHADGYDVTSCDVREYRDGTYCADLALGVHLDTKRLAAALTAPPSDAVRAAVAAQLLRSCEWWESFASTFPKEQPTTPDLLPLIHAARDSLALRAENERLRAALAPFAQAHRDAAGSGLKADTPRDYVSSEDFVHAAEVCPEAPEVES